MNARTTALSALIAMRRQNAWADGALKDECAALTASREALARQLAEGIMGQLRDLGISIDRVEE